MMNQNFLYVNLKYNYSFGKADAKLKFERVISYRNALNQAKYNSATH